MTTIYHSVINLSAVFFYPGSRTRFDTRRETAPSSQGSIARAESKP